MSLTTTTVLGKRKNRVTSETLFIQLSASESTHEQTDVSWQEPESEVESLQTPGNPKQKSEFALVNGSLVKNVKKKYHCTFSGCQKMYAKPCRLEEHERSHTGEVGISFQVLRSIHDVWLNHVDCSGRSCARLAISRIYERRTSKPMFVLTYLIPIAPLSAQRRVAQRGSGLCNI